nr:MAG TPA: hypothetical protein [Caudoviricetes sp.]
MIGQEIQELYKLDGQRRTIPFCMNVGIMSIIYATKRSTKNVVKIAVSLAI